MVLPSGLIVVAPADRLDRLEFDPRAQLAERAVHVGRYRCPGCGTAVELNTTHFQRHHAKHFSNLATEQDLDFTQFRPLDRQRSESFLDFHCPGCRAPVRIIYEPWEFAMGSYAYTVTAIVERRG